MARKPNTQNATDSQPPSVSLWMPVFIDEHRARASTMSHLEHSALCYLNMLLWEHGGDIPDDDNWIARKLRLTARQWKPIRMVVLEDCTLSGGRIYHDGIAAEVAKARANVEQKRIAGRASAEARKAQREANGCSTAVTTDVQPRAGSGSGSGPSQGLIRGGSDSLEGTPFRVVEGGGK